jgi:hypothetical protein
MEIPNIFIFAHGCRSDNKFTSNRIKMYFKNEEGDLCQSDATDKDLNIENYKFMVNQTGPPGNPKNLPNDYELSFYDLVGELGFDTFGVFDETGKSLLDLDKSKGKEYLLSEIINACYHLFNTTKFYLGICRTPCPSSSSGGKNKKRKTNRRKRKNKKRKTNRRNYKR